MELPSELLSRISLAPLPEGLQVPHDDPRDETAPARGIISPKRRQRTPVIIRVLRQMLQEERT